MVVGQRCPLWEGQGTAPWVPDGSGWSQQQVAAAGAGPAQVKAHREMEEETCEETVVGGTAREGPVPQQGEE